MATYQLKTIAAAIEEFAPLQYQEDYDNSGLQVGNPEEHVSSALVCIDVTEEIVDQAIQEGYPLIISHHPLIFKGIKRISNCTEQERILYKAIKHDIAIYAAHTNLDSVANGVSGKLCQHLGLNDCNILQPHKAQLAKIVTFVPTGHAEQVRNAMLSVGAGHIGNYDFCSYNTIGFGTFRAGEHATPFVGRLGELHTEEEVRIETIAERTSVGKVIAALRNAHPYEEPAYDIYSLENTLPHVGLGMVGMLPTPVKTDDFLATLKKQLNLPAIRHTKPAKEVVQRIAVCGGSGASLIGAAIAAKADVYITADVTYHRFFEAEGKILLADIGHYESEQLAIDIIQELLTKKFPTFAVRASKECSNPIRYM